MPCHKDVRHYSTPWLFLRLCFPKHNNSTTALKHSRPTTYNKQDEKRQHQNTAEKMLRWPQSKSTYYVTNTPYKKKALLYVQKGNVKEGIQRAADIKTIPWSTDTLQLNSTTYGVATLFIAAPTRQTKKHKPAPSANIVGITEKNPTLPPPQQIVFLRLHLG